MGFPVMILAELALKVASKAFDKQDAKASLEKAIETDPVLKNAMNAEAPYQSRVVWGSVIAALGVVIPPLAGLFGWNISGNGIVEFLQALMTLGGALFALYGRLKGGLKPLFSKA